MASFSYTELAREDGFTAAVTQEVASSACTYLLSGTNDDTPPTVRQLSEFVPYLIGSIDNLEAKTSATTGDTGAGKIRRSLPKFHPFLPELSAVGVAGIKGVGGQLEADTRQIQFREPITQQFTTYKKYEYRVEFGKRPYELLHDDQIRQGTGTYVLPDGTSRDFVFAEEWLRFTRFNPQPTPDTATAAYGGFKFRTGTGFLPNGAEYIGQTFVYLQNTMIDVDWYQVPMRYLENKTVGGTTYRSYLTRFTNTVNQYEWNGYPRGSLLFLGAQVANIYTPAVPRVRGIFGANLGIAPDLACNLKLKFLYTARETSDPPGVGTSGTANLNNIPTGHNLEPNFADRKFYYASSTGPSPFTDDTKWNAKFQSFPFHLLFTDPMTTQPGGVI